MSNFVEIMVLVEGQTEKFFIDRLLCPYLAEKNIFLRSMLLTKPLQKGGDVRFVRAQRDIGNHLRQRKDTYITLMVDYYGIGKDWEGLEESKRQPTHSQKAEIINRETAKKIQELFSEQNQNRRFIPYVSMHEIEALYFSNPAILAEKINIKQAEIDSILKECGEPEAINDDFNTAPSKRLEKLSKTFVKTTTGITIAQEIGIEQMRKHCPLFDAWIKKMENLRA